MTLKEIIRPLEAVKDKMTKLQVDALNQVKQFEQSRAMGLEPKSVIRITRISKPVEATEEAKLL